MWVDGKGDHLQLCAMDRVGGGGGGEESLEVCLVTIEVHK